jgi:murein DD-endopeptidase MepM/ murein hydrolase activator NlpD
MGIYCPQRKFDRQRRLRRTRQVHVESNWSENPPPQFTRRHPRILPNTHRALGHHHPQTTSSSLMFLVQVLLTLVFALFLALVFVLLPDLFFFSQPHSSYSIGDTRLAELSLPQLKPHRTLSITHTIRSGETLRSIAKNYGFSWEASQELEDEVKKLEQENDSKLGLHSGQKLRFILDDTGALKQITTRSEPGQEMVIKRSAEGSFVSTLHKFHHEPKERVAIGAIETSFAAAADKAGVPYDVVDDLVDILGGKISFHRDFQKGDRFTVIYKDILQKDGKSHKPGPILAAVFEAGGKEYTAVRYVGTDGKARYFDQDGKPYESGFLRYPAKFSRISSPFSHSRFHPVLKYFRPHNGVDFAAPAGTPVRTVADGEIVIAGRRGPSGIMVKIKHSDRYTTAYLHLSSIAKDIRPGGHVARGQFIGAVGSTGLSSGPHLHYSFYDRGHYTDPLKIALPMLSELSEGTKIHKEYLNRVLFTLRHYQKISLSGSYLALAPSRAQHNPES